MKFSQIVRKSVKHTGERVKQLGLHLRTYPKGPTEMMTSLNDLPFFLLDESQYFCRHLTTQGGSVVGRGALRVDQVTPSQGLKLRVLIRVREKPYLEKKQKKRKVFSRIN
jgi:hypothetical protein